MFPSHCTGWFIASITGLIKLIWWVATILFKQPTITYYNTQPNNQKDPKKGIVSIYASCLFNAVTGTLVLRLRLVELTFLLSTFQKRLSGRTLNPSFEIVVFNAQSRLMFPWHYDRTAMVTWFSARFAMGVALVGASPSCHWHPRTGQDFF